MVEKYFGGVIPEPSDNRYLPEGEEIHAVGALRMLLLARRSQAARHFDALEFAGALECVVDLARQCNLRIDGVAPWKLMKVPNPEGTKVVGDLLQLVADCLKCSAILLAPAMPEKSRALWLQLGLDDPEFDAVRIGLPGEGQKNTADLEELRVEKEFESLDAVPVAGRRVRKGEPLFPRRDAKDEGKPK